MILGLTGGIACGKTTVSDMFEELGAYIIDTDILAREAVLPVKPAFKKIIDYFGKEILLIDGTINRKKLGNIVFRDFEKRKTLEEIIHPAINELFKKRVENIVKKDRKVIISAVVPLLIEKNMQEKYDKIIVVYVPEKLQIERLMNRDKISKKEALIKIKSQIPIDKKLRFADYVIYNDKTLEDTKKQATKLWYSFR
jgi:dephospho-CoA kinase